MRRTTTSRPGLTILELLVVLAAILILGAVVMPTIGAFRGNTRVKAAADTVRGRMAEARMKAIEEGQPYRVAISPDGKRLRVAPDTFEAMGGVAQADGETAGPFIREDDLPAEVSAELMMDEDSFTAQDTNGWRRIATFQPDGTCKEDSVSVLLQEIGVAPLIVRLRGLTGVTTVVSASPAGGHRP